MSEIMLVNENDEPIGVADKLEVHQKGLLHRAFSVFVYRKGLEGLEILLQKRHSSKYHSGGLWTNTCCSHPLFDETIKEAAEKRLKEEMGITSDLTEIGVFHYKAEVGNNLIENEIDHVFVGELLFSKIKFHPEEVEAITWMSVKQLGEELKNNPKNYTAWLEKAFKIFREVVLREG
ncbi:MAG TPA: isopentenyl-diphosphate Delta-isomerase [Gammaproteobacteria bacterium]|nr:isopentenyl-diphosphate Delta-isomerase [Gammaproteobacteria bacterium]